MAVESGQKVRPADGSDLASTPSWTEDDVVALLRDRHAQRSADVHLEIKRVFFDAVRRDDVQTVTSFVTVLGPARIVNAVDDQGRTALMYAAASSSKNVVAYLLNCDGIKITMADEKGKLALHHAVYAAGRRRNPAASSKVLELLLSGRGSAAVDLRDKNGRPPLMYAAALGDVSTASSLLRAEAGINLQDFDGYTPADHASLCRQKDVLKLLTDHGGFLTVDEGGGDRFKERINFLEELFRDEEASGDNFRAKTTQGADHAEYMRKRDKAASYIIRRWRAFMFTQYSWLLSGKSKAAQYVELPWSPADSSDIPSALDIPNQSVGDDVGVRAVSPTHAAPIAASAPEGRVATIGADEQDAAQTAGIDEAPAFTEDGLIALVRGRGLEATYEEMVPHFLDASRRGDLKSMQSFAAVLGETGILGCTDHHGRSALMYAAGGAHKEVVEFLLKSGEVDVYAVDQQKCTALHHTAKNVRRAEDLTLCSLSSAIATMLVEEKAELDGSDHRSCTALMYAAAVGDVLTAEVLLNRKANVNAPDRLDMTALDHAKQCRRVAVEDLLLSSGGLDGACDQGDKATLFEELVKEASEEQLVVDVSARAGHVDVAGKTKATETPPPQGITAEEPHYADAATWFSRLAAANCSVLDVATGNSNERYVAQLARHRELGRFAAACRAGAVLAVHLLLLDPYGSVDFSHLNEDDGPIPVRIPQNHPACRQCQPRFSGDRVFLYDTLVLVLVGGDIDAGFDLETAWRIYKHDATGMQALADALDEVDCASPIVRPHVVVVEYLGFKVFCTPQREAACTDPFSLVLGPLPEATTAVGAASDLPDLWRAAMGARRQEVSLVLHEWEHRNPQLRNDLRRIAHAIGIQDYPVVLDASDLPPTIHTTALMRAPDASDLHFRTPVELLPPEVLSVDRPSKPTQRLRPEALRLLGFTGLPVALRASGAVASQSASAGTSAGLLQAVARRAATDLPARMLDAIETEGTPLDSAAWTTVFHRFGLNMRHLGRVASSAVYEVRKVLHREALARSAKWIFRKALWKRTPWKVLAREDSAAVSVGPERIAVLELLRVLNLVLGGDQEASIFWDSELVPETVRRFGVPASGLERPTILAAPLCDALQYHLGVCLKVRHERRFHDPSQPKPFIEDDMLRFTFDGGHAWLPHAEALQVRISRLRLTYANVSVTSDSLGNAIRKMPLAGFYPVSTVVCARGREWAVADAMPKKLMKQRQAAHAYQILNMKLSLERAIGASLYFIGSTLQDIAISLLGTTKLVEEEDRQVAMHGRRAKMKRKVPGDYDDEVRQRLVQSLWTADVAIALLPGFLSSWWANIAALEAEWKLRKAVEARVRNFRMELGWERSARDQPRLRFRLETVLTDLCLEFDQWKVAAIHAATSVNLSSDIHGGVHSTTIALWERLGSIHSRAAEPSKAIEAYRHGLACGEALNERDVKQEGRLHFYLARVLREEGDLSVAKFHGEEAVKCLMPQYGTAEADERVGSASVNDKVQALDSLTQLGGIYSQLVLRSQEISDSPISLATENELVHRSIRCFEFYLAQISLSEGTLGGEGVNSKYVNVVMDILELRMRLIGTSEKALLVDAVENLLITTGMEKVEAEEVLGIATLHPRSQTRSIAEAALVLNRESADLKHQVQELAARLATETFAGRQSPSEWFDATMYAMAGGFTADAGTNSPGYQATLHMMNLYRYFGGRRMRQ